MAAHPGVVEILATEGGSEPGALLLRKVDGSTLAERSELPAMAMARIGAALATTLADLHDIGVVHRALEPGHVLIDGSSRPVLCGFGSSRYAAGTEHLEQWRRDDAAALAKLLLGACTGALGPRAAAVLRAAASGRSRTGLRSRPVDARHIARALAGAASSAGTTRRAETPAVRAATPGRPLAAWRAGRGTRLALSGSVIAGGLTMVAILRLSSATGSPVSPEPHRAALASAPARCPPQDDGCVPLTDGGTANGRVGLGYRIVGAPGVVVLGRWDCRSTATPAVLDPSTGRVWVFDTWPGDGGRVAARLVAIAPGASTLRVVPQVHKSCDRIQIEGSGQPARVANPISPDVGQVQ
ncbi:MAG TPA: hypothetical protein VFJ79_05215 [Acidimicrobiales bacterium]|nr:hypothetical protein [Acidimicrobiales bacterium]